jgi:hypothetical protein
MNELYAQFLREKQYLCNFSPRYIKLFRWVFNRWDARSSRDCVLGGLGGGCHTSEQACQSLGTACLLYVWLTILTPCGLRWLYTVSLNEAHHITQ